MAARYPPQAMPFRHCLSAADNPCAIKAVLAMMGLIPDGLRLPMVEASEDLRRRLEQALPAILAL